MASLQGARRPGARGPAAAPAARGPRRAGCRQHYGAVKAGQQAGAVTYFGFLSFFPILALAFFVVGYVAQVYPERRGEPARRRSTSVLPGLIGPEDGQISLADDPGRRRTGRPARPAGVLYSGLGWLSAMRDALAVVFELPAREQPNFVVGKLRDLLALVVIGVVLMLSRGGVRLRHAASPGRARLARARAPASRPLLQAGHACCRPRRQRAAVLRDVPAAGRAAHPDAGRCGRARCSAPSASRSSSSSPGCCSASTKGQPAFQAFGIALILLVWINYFSRVVLYAAAWAHTSRAARAQRVPRAAPSPARVRRTPPRRPAPRPRPGARPATGPAPFAAGGATALALVRRTPPTTEGRDELERKHGWLLLGVAAWNVVIWVTFAKNLSAALRAGEDRPTGYWVAHTVLIVVDLVIAVVLARLGCRRPSCAEGATRRNTARVTTESARPSTRRLAVSAPRPAQ